MSRIFTLILTMLCLSAFGQGNYPVPPASEKTLFYLQRSHNKNTIIYDINLLPGGGIDFQDPLNVYWIRYEEGGAKAELSFVQKMAFGAECKLIDKSKGNFVIHFNRFSKRDVYLYKTSNGRYKAYININNELSELNKVYIQSENNSLGMPVSVKFLEFCGISVKTGKTIIEKMIP